MKSVTSVLGMAVLATVAGASVQSAQGAYISGAPIVVDVGGNGANPDTGTTALGTISYNHSWTSTVNNLVETDGTVATGTSFNVFVGGQPGGFYLNSAGSGLVLAGEAADLFPSGPAHNFFGTFSGPLAYSFGGLDTATVYNVDVYAGQISGNAGAGAGSYSATGANSVTGSLDSTNNTSTVLHLLNVTPDANGLIKVTANPGIISAVRLSIVAPEPTSLGLLGFAGMGLLARRRK